MVGAVVVVRGEASLEGPPDLATLSVTVHRAGSSAEKVRSELAQASAALGLVVESFRAALASSGTSGLHVGPVLPQGETRRTSYRGSYGVSLVVHDFDVLSPLVTAVTEQTGAQLDGPWWSLGPHSPLPRQARLAAVPSPAVLAPPVNGEPGAGSTRPPATRRSSAPPAEPRRRAVTNCG